MKQWIFYSASITEEMCSCVSESTFIVVCVRVEGMLMKVCLIMCFVGVLVSDVRLQECVFVPVYVTVSVCVCLLVILHKEMGSVIPAVVKLRF